MEVVHEKKLFVKIFTLITCISLLLPVNIYAEGDMSVGQKSTDSVQSQSNVSPDAGSITPYGMILYDQIHPKVSDSTWLPINGVRTSHLTLTVSIFFGRFMGDTSGYIELGTHDPQYSWALDTSNCFILSATSPAVPSVQINPNYPRSNTRTQTVRIQSYDTSTSTTSSLTKTEALNIMNTTGAKIKVKGVEITDEFTLNKTWGSSTTNSVTITTNSGFTATYLIVTYLTGNGTIETVSQ